MKNNHISFSIIIPHKNIPKLLQRCLDSIPKRNDVEVIIVDDNSCPTIVDFDDFPGLGDPIVKVIFAKEGGGAGYARNIGILNSSGYWLVFADADDFFNESFNDALNRYKQSQADLICFCSNSVDSKSLDPIKNRGEYYNKILSGNLNNGVSGAGDVRFRIDPPWAKFIKSELLEKNDIRFDEVYSANDVMFSVKVGYFSKRIIVDLNKIYCVVKRSNSLQYNITEKNIDSRSSVKLELYKFLKERNLEHFHKSIWIHVYQYILRGKVIKAFKLLSKSNDIMGWRVLFDDFIRALGNILSK